MAMLDALDLSEALLKMDQVICAFKNYENKMLERAKEVTAITM